MFRNRLSILLAVAGSLFLAGCGPASMAAGPAQSLSARPQERPAARESGRFVPDQVLVKFRRSVQAGELASFHARFQTRELQRLAGIDVRLLQILDGTPVPAMVRKVEQSPLVEYAEPNYEVSIGIGSR